MAVFIGSNPKSENWGEDYVLEKCVAYFDDSCIIYRNREVFGTQFDLCVLIPDQGLLVLEVKAWKAASIDRVEHGDTIILHTSDGREEPQNPTKQARGYMFSLKNKIRQKTGKVPLVLPVVCFPLLSRQDYDAKGLEPVCEYETTVLKEDLLAKAAFYQKINLAMHNALRQLSCVNPFTPEFMLQVRQIFEPSVQSFSAAQAQEPSPSHVPEPGSAYSLLYYLPQDEPLDTPFVETLCRCYQNGTKLIVIVRRSEQLVQLASALDAHLIQRGVARKGEDIQLCFSQDSALVPPVAPQSTAFRAFNCLICVDASEKHPAFPPLCITDGQIPDEQTRQCLETLGRCTAFNYEQFLIEHADPQKNIVIRAGAGTGKTFTMISRIGFLCHTQSRNVLDMAERIVMITFTNDAADQMERKIKQYFNNYYLLTGQADYLRFIAAIEKMQISTIHSYAKKLISLLGQELGYGVNVRVKSGEYTRKQLVAEELDAYLQKKQFRHGSDYIAKLGLPVYVIREDVLAFINALHNKSIDVANLAPESFGHISAGGEQGQALHELLATLVPAVEKRYAEQLLQDNSLHLSAMMSMLGHCLSQPANLERLRQLRIDSTQFLFVDEFQDTDDTQIKALLKIAGLLHYKLFVVGDIKQCIYRFRGAKEKAFDQLPIQQSPSDWLEFSLNKNFRTDARLLNLFHRSFSQWGQPQEDGEPLLVYKDSQDRLLGTRRYNPTNYTDNKFYTSLSVPEEKDRMDVLFSEVERQIQRIRYEMQSGRALSDDQKKIAILVRENWQADVVRKEGKRRNYTVITNTGGDLYRTEPALDMLTLANALLHYDESDHLYALVNSNFIRGPVSKAYLYQLRQQQSDWRSKHQTTDTSQAQILQNFINHEMGSSGLKWNDLILSLRVEPVMQVVRKIYSALRPWANYGEGNSWKENYYRQNVDLLFEQLMTTANLNVLTINSLVDILLSNIRSCKNVDSRTPELTNEEISIQCITVHKSKGLEYGAVILPYCSYAIDRMKRADLYVSTQEVNGTIQVGYKLTGEGTILQNDFFDPDVEKAEREREEMRILYVAMTRAIHAFSWLRLEGHRTTSWQNMIWEAKDDAL